MRATEGARSVADAAQRVADAVNQHFFADGNGIHVTEATQEDWNTNHSGANVLINALGQLFRDGLNNLLTLTTEGNARALTVWDGLGNAAENVLAIFGASETRLGLGGGTGSIFLASDKFRLRGVTKDRSWSASGSSGTVREAFGNILSETVWDGPNQSESWNPSTDYSYVSRAAVNTYSYVPTDHSYGGQADLKLSATVYDWKGESPETDDLIPEEDNGFDPYISPSHSNDASIELHAEPSNPDNNGYIALRADALVLDGAVQRTEGTCTATTANATIISAANHCWTNNATTTITVGVNLKSSLANSSAVAIATAPADFRPPYTVVGSVYVTGQAVNLQAWIDNAGRITVNNRSGTSVTTSANIYISFTFAP